MSAGMDAKQIELPLVVRLMVSIAVFAVFVLSTGVIAHVSWRLVQLGWGIG